MVRLIVGNQPFQRATSLYIRFSVFVLERKIKMEDECDANDNCKTIYAVLYDGNQPVSTGRFLPETTDQARLTRIATLKDYRGKGYGGKVIQALERHARAEGYTRLVIHAELTAKSFYESIGYQLFGHEYEEDGEICQSLAKEWSVC
ncbi:GNAT family N-acetyltransferase [Streptococcus iniae]|nr:GNAT family N-acetyltransferase [Streptococcus iniae]WNZ97591.1 GNAT family N-acetyltransferase [Streptococcus iniae]